MSEGITVEALDERISFKSMEALQEHVNEILENRGGVFAPMDLACIRALVANANGDAPDEATRIARSTAIFTPSKPDRPATPLDAKIEEAEERLAEADAELADAFDHRTEVRAGARAEVAALRARAEGTPAEIGRRVAELRGRLRGRIEDANAEYLRVREGRTRACARVNALLVARDRWRAAEAAEYHNNDN